jgi:hypothetical protein
MPSRLILTATLAAAALAVLPARAHLCNDVFVQARDNLAVKVDIRDGQLRIAKEGAFRVYLLNTMDRDIANIQLAVEGPGFTTSVKPSKEWKGFPHLKTTRRGGEKEYFDVTVTRKAGTADGKYKLALRLYNGEDASMEFKTVDLAAAAATHPLTTAKKITVDGRADQQEWGTAVLCTGFSEYVKGKGGYQENRQAANQPRVRVTADAANLYLCPTFQGAAAGKDTLTLYVAASTDAAPAKIEIDRIAGTVTADGAAIPGAEARKSTAGDALEVKLPFSTIGLVNGKSFYLNMARTTNGKGGTAYWRGNEFSVNNPVVFDRFVLGGK